MSATCHQNLDHKYQGSSLDTFRKAENLRNPTTPPSSGIQGPNPARNTGHKALQQKACGRRLRSWEAAWLVATCQVWGLLWEVLTQREVSRGFLHSQQGVGRGVLEGFFQLVCAH